MLPYGVFNWRQQIHVFVDLENANARRPQKKHRRQAKLTKMVQPVVWNNGNNTSCGNKVAWILNVSTTAVGSSVEPYHDRSSSLPVILTEETKPYNIQCRC